jgi:hypothetical protein
MSINVHLIQTESQQRSTRVGFYYKPNILSKKSEVHIPFISTWDTVQNKPYFMPQNESQWILNHIMHFLQPRSKIRNTNNGKCGDCVNTCEINNMLVKDQLVSEELKRWVLKQAKKQETKPELMGCNKHGTKREDHSNKSKLNKKLIIRFQIT